MAPTVAIPAQLAAKIIRIRLSVSTIIACALVIERVLSLCPTRRFVLEGRAVISFGVEALLTGCVAVTGELVAE